MPYNKDENVMPYDKDENVMPYDKEKQNARAKTEI